MIHTAIYGSQIIDFNIKKIRQHPCPRVAEFFLTKLGEKIFSLNCTINRIFMKSGKHQKGIFLVCEFRQQQGTGFLGLLVFVNPSLGLYICDICSGFRTNRKNPNLAEILPSVGRKISATSYSKEENRILSSSPPPDFGFLYSTKCQCEYKNLDLTKTAHTVSVGKRRTVRKTEDLQPRN